MTSVDPATQAVPGASAAGRAPALLRAIAALGAFGCAAAGQALLEQVRNTEAPASPHAGHLFLVGAVLAVLATWASRRTVPAVRFEIVVPRWPWFVACLPAVLSLLTVVRLRAQPGCAASCDALSHWLWAGGIVWLVGVGTVQWLTVRRPVAGVPSRGRTVLAVAALVVIALALRTYGDVRYLPSFIESDEANQGIYARGLGLYDLFGVYWVGIPDMSIAITRLAQLTFGDSLWGIRMGGVTLGVLSVVCLYGMARRLAGERVALMAGVLLAVAHTHIHWSRNGQHFIQTPAAAAVVLYLLVRVWTRGSLLSWVLAGIALGIGTQTYQASYALPVLVLVTAAGWAASTRIGWKRFLVSTLAIEVIAILLLAPVVMTMAAQWERSVGRPQSLFLLTPEHLARLPQAFGVATVGEALLRHAEKTVLIFNTSTDFYSCYGARRSLVDVVTAAMVPLAAAMLLSRLFSPLGWLCLSWSLAYLTLGVFLCAHPPSYHRVPTALLFSSLGVAWAVVELLRRVVEGFRLPRVAATVLGCVFLAAAAWANVDYYFREYWSARPMNHGAALTWLVCRYAEARTIVDATALDGHEYVPVHNDGPKLECPNARRVRRTESAKLWDLSDLTEDARLVLIVPEVVVERHPGTPGGYRVTHRYVDRSTLSPVALPLVVFELERVASGTPATGRDS